MSKIFLLMLSFAAMLFSADQIICQDIDFYKMIGIQIETGYTSFDLEKVRSNYGLLANAVRQNDIPLKTQKEFPANGLIGGKIFLSLSDNIRLNAGYGFSKSKAYSLYSDYAGSLGIIGSVNMQYYSTGATLFLSESKLLRPFCEIGIGAVSGKYDNQVKTVLTGISSTEILSSYKGNGIYFEMEAGLQYNYSLMHMYFSGSYRYARISSINESIFVDGKKQFSNDINENSNFNIDFSGFALKAGLGFELNLL